MRSVKGSLGVYLYILGGSASVALMRGSASVPMIYGVLPVLHLCVVPVALALRLSWFLWRSYACSNS